MRASVCSLTIALLGYSRLVLPEIIIQSVVVDHRRSRHFEAIVDPPPSRARARSWRQAGGRSLHFGLLGCCRDTGRPACGHRTTIRRLSACRAGRYCRRIHSPGGTVRNASPPLGNVMKMIKQPPSSMRRVPGRGRQSRAWAAWHRRSARQVANSRERSAELAGLVAWRRSTPITTRTHLTDRFGHPHGLHGLHGLFRGSTRARG